MSLENFVNPWERGGFFGSEVLSKEAVENNVLDTISFIKNIPQNYREILKYKEKATIYLYGREESDFGSLGKEKFLNLVKNDIEFIYKENGINWLDIRITDKSVHKFTLNQIDSHIRIGCPNCDSKGETENFLYSRVKLYGPNQTLDSPYSVAHTCAHELLHQFLARLGYLLFGNWQYFQPSYDGHFNQLNGKDYINLNMTGSLLLSKIGEPLKADKAPRRLYSIHKFYIKNMRNYLFLKDFNLLKYLTLDKPLPPEHPEYYSSKFKEYIRRLIDIRHSQLFTRIGQLNYLTMNTKINEQLPFNIIPQ